MKLTLIRNKRPELLVRELTISQMNRFYEEQGKRCPVRPMDTHELFRLYGYRGVITISGEKYKLIQ